MITEDYVSFEVAKLLKEKGFDEATFHEYQEYDGKGIRWFEEVLVNHNSQGGVACPTLQMVIKWLEEVHHILVIPDYIYECTNTSWVYKIYRLGENGKPERNAIIGTSYDSNGNPTQHIVGYRDYDISKQEYATRTEAVEEGIKHCLKSL